jgi:hypothetical protein
MTRFAISASLPMIGRIATARGRRAAREFAELADRFLPVSPAALLSALNQIGRHS